VRPLMKRQTQLIKQGSKIGSFVVIILTVLSFLGRYSPTSGRANDLFL
jgi:hypothetical protein